MESKFNVDHVNTVVYNVGKGVWTTYDNADRKGCDTWHQFRFSGGSVIPVARLRAPCVETFVDPFAAWLWCVWVTVCLSVPG